MLPCLLLLACARLPAVELIRIETPRLDFPGGYLEEIDLSVRLAKRQPALSLRAARIRLAAGWELRTVRFTCPQLVLEAEGADCREGTLTASLGGRMPLHYGVRIRYDPEKGEIRLRLQGRKNPFGVLNLRLGTRDGAAGSLEVSGLSLEALARLARVIGIRLPLPDLKGSGDLHASFRSQRRGGRWQAQGRMSGLAFSDAEGTLAAEEGVIRWQAAGRWQGQDLSGWLGLDWLAGALYADPVYLEAGAGAPPLHLEGAFRWRSGGLVLRDIRYRHPGVLALALDRLALPGKEPPGLTLDVRVPDLGKAWPLYLQPWLAGTLADDLALRGSVEGQLRLVRGRPQQLRLRWREGGIEDRLGRIRLEGLEIDLDHARDGREHRSRIRWRKGRLYRVALGPARFPLRSRGDRWELESEAALPVLDGWLLMDRLFVEVAEGGEPLPRWGFDAVLTPVSLQKLSRALGWPTFAGTLSGMIPDVLYENHRLAVGGVLLAQVFDGNVRVRNLVLERPFGRFPRLTADIEIDRLDLEQLTSAFSFGRIEGRLSGYIRHLVLEDWQPVAFDAWLGTPDDYRGPRRISQRAVENLSSIGGGATGALSKGILRFFENFPYARLGIGCRLENGVCRMRGVAPAPGGYYIVRGRLLPHLDVVGYATEVDWKTLVARLQAATQGGEAKIR